jgi:DNA-directed RNA polymerase subunit RPC12/RpoP
MEAAPVQVTALRRRPCADCGGDTEWNPAKQALVCPYCGSVVPGAVAPQGGEVIEHDLAAALRNAPAAARGWQTDTVSVKCQSCHAISVFDAGRAAQRCDFCGSPAIVPYEETRDAIRPGSLLPITQSEPTVRDALRRWYATRWFAPSRLKHAALTDTLKGVYLPYWTFDARAEAHWTAESGYHYYTTETYRDAQGNTRTRRVQHTRWEPSHGHLTHFFDDTLVPGTVGVHGGLLRRIEPFPTEQLVPYDPSFLRGWTVERYQVDLGRAAETSRQAMEAELRTLCAGEVPGDTHRRLEIEAHYSDRTFKHVLLPVWLLTYTYGARSFQVLVNGATGAIAGERPYSAPKILGAALCALLTLAAIAVLWGHG